MFRKKLAVLVAAALMTLTASSAFAAFSDLELIRVYYDRAGAEIATDLGKVSDFTAAGATKTIAGSFGSLTTGFASYFALDRSTNQLWASGSTTTASMATGTSLGLTSMKSGTTVMYSLFNGQGGTNYTGSAAALSSYKNKLSATQGNMASAVAAGSRLNTEASLISVLAGGSVNQGLWFWANANGTTTTQKTGVLAAIITTNADGSTVITSSTPAPVTSTPIPAAMYLMGSGLLGLVGMRRRNKVA